MSPIDTKQLELNRIIDMIKTRGYSVVGSRFQNDTVVVDAEKVFTPELLPTREAEATWFGNFLKSFGWSLQSSSFTENKVIVQFVKVVKVVTP